MGGVGHIVPFFMRIKRVLPVSPYKIQVFHRGAKEIWLGAMLLCYLELLPAIQDGAIICGGEKLFSVS